MAEPASSSFRNTLRRLANEADPTERARVADLFASQIELALDSQGGNMQVALWNVEEGVAKKIDDIHKSLSDTNTLSTAVLEVVTGLKAGQDGVTAAIQEIARGLGKTNQAVEGLKQGQSTLATRVSGLGEELNGFKDETGQRLDKLEQRVGTIEGTVARIAVATERNRSGIERLIQWTKDQPIPDEIKRHLDDAAKQ